MPKLAWSVNQEDMPYSRLSSITSSGENKKLWTKSWWKNDIMYLNMNGLDLEDPLCLFFYRDIYGLKNTIYRRIITSDKWRLFFNDILDIIVVLSHQF